MSALVFDRQDSTLVREPFFSLGSALALHAEARANRKKVISYSMVLELRSDDHA